ncbi:cytosolic protein [Rivularia sp. UHCC 0363]|uniref:cytosolic protein n=1 Tax=Rivularia sp. UHCC 0363 TaxID=3110244 RepID=UPI002B1F6CC6|nr:cytosolic protein [Rivularia sp. UHCC 0363]MEA5596694.1 cytosolic protein [Rivularia sp. UHCC 0363]
MTNPQTKYDSPWKEILQLYFQDFMLFFFPQFHAQIDWSKEPVFLDKELQQVIRDAELGKRLVDKLVKIYLLDGTESWILIHIEVQGQEEDEFSRRMYVYNYRIFDCYNRSVVSIAILGDANSDWRPHQFGYNLFGCRLDFQFPIVKLIDYRQRFEELEASSNPFATLVMAHLIGLETGDNRTQRKQRKIALIRGLYEKGFEREKVVNLFRLIDWMLTLPLELEREFWREYREYEESKDMRYVTSVERIGIEQGIEQGIKQGTKQGLIKGIALGLQLKFGDSGTNLLPEIEEIGDVDVLSAVLDAIAFVETIEQLRQVYQSNA